MKDGKKSEAHPHIVMDPVWEALGLIGVCLIGLCYGIAIGGLALSGHYEGTSTLFSVAGWCFTGVLVLWLLVDWLAEGTAKSDLTWNGLYLNKTIVGLAVVTCILLFIVGLTVGRSLLSSWDDSLDLGSFSTIFILAGVLLTVISYNRGVLPYRVQWRAWSRHGRETTPYQEEAESEHHRRYGASGGDPRGWSPRRVGPFKLREWVFEFVFDWALFIIGIVSVAGGFALKMI